MAAHGHFPPVWKTPVTDIFGPSLTGQANQKCAGFELRAMECLAAYTFHNRDACAAYLGDYKECITNQLEYKRMSAMRVERHKQYFTGEKEEHYMPLEKGDLH